MKWKMVLGAALAGALCSPTPLVAQTTQPNATDAEISHDVQCMLIGLHLQRSPNAAAQASGEQMSNFFSGRALGSAPNTDLTAAVLREADVLIKNGPSGMSRVGYQCANETNARVAQVNAAVAALKQRGH